MVLQAWMLLDLGMRNHHPTIVLPQRAGELSEVSRAKLILIPSICESTCSCFESTRSQMAQKQSSSQWHEGEQWQLAIDSRHKHKLGTGWPIMKLDDDSMMMMMKMMMMIMWELSYSQKSRFSLWVWVWLSLLRLWDLHHWRDWRGTTHSDVQNPEIECAETMPAIDDDYLIEIPFGWLSE